MGKGNKGNKGNKNQPLKEKKNFKPLRAILHHYSPDKVKEMKQQISEDMYNISKNSKENMIFDSLLDQEDQDYFYNYKTYVNEEFSQRLANMTVRYVKHSPVIPIDLKENEENFICKFIDLIKRLLMSEFEFAFFTILIDEKGCKYKNLNFWRIMKFYGLATKTFFGDSKLVLYILDKKPELNDEYNIWLNCKENTNIIKRTNERIADINQRHKELTKITNSYCRKDYVDLNGVVDQIIKLSQPYKSTQSIGTNNLDKSIINPSININNLDLEANNYFTLNTQNNQKKIQSQENIVGIQNSQDKSINNQINSDREKNNYRMPIPINIPETQNNIQMQNSIRNLTLSPQNSLELFDRCRNNNIFLFPKNSLTGVSIDPLSGFENLNDDSIFRRAPDNCFFNQSFNANLSLNNFSNLYQNNNNISNISLVRRESSFYKENK